MELVINNRGLFYESDNEDGRRLALPTQYCRDKLFQNLDLFDYLVRSFADSYSVLDEIFSLSIYTSDKVQ